MYDAISLNPLGVTSFSLIIPGFMIYTARHLFMPNQRHLQFLCGLFVGILQPLISFVILLTARKTPFFSVDMMMVITVSGLICGIVTPAIYKTVSWLDKTFNYKKADKNSFRQDREIIRGK
jgi:cell shape-determining protein MreD